MSNKNKNRGFVEEVSEPVVMAEEKPAEHEKVDIPTTTQNPVVAKASTEKPKITKVKVRVPLNVRKGPSLSEMAIDVVMPDRVVRIYEEKSGWGRIGNERWINLSSDYVERV